MASPTPPATLRPHAATSPEATGDRAAPSATVTLSSGRRYELEATPTGDRLTVRGRDGGVVLLIEVTDAGPVLSFAAPGGEHAAASRGAGEAGALPPPTRPSSPRRAVIMPPPSAASGPRGDAAAEPLVVPRASPLPSISRLLAEEPAKRGRAGSEAVARHPDGERRDGAGASDASMRAASGFASRPAGPRRELSSETRRSLPSLSLEQYAALCAEAAVGAASSLDRALLRYGIADRDLWTAIDQRWQARLEREPMLTLRWMELTTRYREQLTRR